MAKTRKTPVKRTTKKIVDVAPVAPEVPVVPSSVEPVVSPEPVDVVADAVGTPEGAEPPEKPDHYIPKPTFTLLEDGRYQERQLHHPRTITIDSQQYEHVSEASTGHWIYARS